MVTNRTSIQLLSNIFVFILFVVLLFSDDGQQSSINFEKTELKRWAKLLGVPDVDVENKLDAIFKDVEMFYTKYFGDISKSNVNYAYAQFRIDNEKDLQKFIDETSAIMKIRSPMFVFDDPNINTGKQLPPSVVEIMTGEKSFCTNDGTTISIFEPGYMGFPVDKFSQQYIILGVTYGIAKTQSQIMVQLLEQWGNHLPPTVGDIIVFRGVVSGLRDASIEMQSIAKNEDEIIKMNINLVDWKRLATAKNPIYRFMAIYCPYDNFRYTNEELIDFYRSYMKETDPEIRKCVIGSLLAIVGEKDGEYKDIYNQAKELYDELQKKWNVAE